jgi:hypothetical protein
MSSVTRFCAHMTDIGLNTVSELIAPPTLI